ncbi:hypothetical protein DFJ73DRAFT_819692 [Zopfochytrium polystomum]|nr:hypothetical protein DFJ73DRAFT_819692 [Zopfochytrium polystomum]
MAPAHESNDSGAGTILFDAPVYVETCFKVTLKGGYRYIEPKGPLLPSESKVWILKIATVMPSVPHSN